MSDNNKNRTILLTDEQKIKIRRYLMTSWAFINLICEKIYNLTPQIYFDDKNDDLRRVLDRFLEGLLEEFVKIRNETRPHKDNGEIDQKYNSVYIKQYPDLPLNEVGSFRKYFAHIYPGIKYSYVWDFIYNDLWKFYNFIIEEISFVCNIDDKNPVIYE